MSLLRFVGLMLMSGAPVLLLVARVAFGPTSPTRALIALRFLVMGAGAVLLSFRDLGMVIHIVGSALLGATMSDWLFRASRASVSSSQ